MDELAQFSSRPAPTDPMDAMVERAVMLAPGEVVAAELLSPRIWGEEDNAGSVGAAEHLNEAVDQLKRLLISRALKAEGNKTRAAARLGLTRQSLQQMMKRLGME